jgi:hypothetical protein
MTPERWQDVERLFHGALERPIDQRAAFLDESSAGDDALRREVESLLEEDSLASNFLEGPLDRYSLVRWVSSRRSQALASFQSRFMVSGDTPRTSAVSSTSSPPKKRSSTT